MARSAMLVEMIWHKMAQFHPSTSTTRGSLLAISKLSGYAIVLPNWVDANQIAELSAAAIKFNPNLSLSL
jgi:hypothetical protein